MPKGQTKFQYSWYDKELDGIQIKEWCVSTEDVYSAKCNLCCETFDISGGGFSQVRSHHNGKKHRQKFDSRFITKKKYTILDAFKKNDSEADNSLSCENQVLNAETLWALRVADGNFSFKSCTETIELFKKMFVDSKIASAMQLKEKKVAYVITHGLSKYFEESLMKDINNCSTRITLAFDETTNVQIKRQMDIYARYWSSEFNSVSCRYLTSVFLGHATADIILEKLLDSLLSYSIPLDKIICLSMDNPNVNKSVLRKFCEKIGSKESILPIGTCNLHVVNNAFKTFLNALTINFDEFANDVHFFLKNSAVRREDFKNVEQVTQETANFLLKHVNSRWLSAGPVAQRLLEQWPNMKEYFLKFLPRQKLLEKQLSTSTRYKRIRECLEEPLMQCYLAFIAFMHKHFEAFSLCFQSKTPKIHILFGEMNKLMRKILLQFVKDDVVLDKEGSSLMKIDIDSGENWKKLNELEIGMTAKSFLEKQSVNEKKNFMLNVRSSLLKTVKYLKSNLPFSDQVFKDFEIFQPKIPSSICDGLNAITRISRYLKFSDTMIDNIRDEWKLFSFDIISQEKLSEFRDMRIDEYWRELFIVKDNSNQFKYKNLATLIKTVLVLPHGNSDPERGFSINKALIDINHSEKSIQSLRLVKDAIQSYGGVLNVPITLPLLSAVKDSHKLYMDYTKKLKEEKEKLEKEKKQMKMEVAVKEETTKRKQDLDAQICENNKKINELKKNKEIALGLINEGTERLKKAAAKKNTVEITVAQNLICEGTSQLQKLESQLATYETEKDEVFKKRLRVN